MLLISRSRQAFRLNFHVEFINRFLEWACLLCGVVLIIVWPLPGTIAARNIALALGCLTSLYWICANRPKVNVELVSPIICLLAVPAWLWAHYFFMPTDTAAQLYDLRGTWFRVILAVVMAGGLGLMLAKHPNRLIWIIVAMTLLALATLGKFFLDVLEANQLFIRDFRYPFKYKSALVGFLMTPCLLAYGYLHYFLRCQAKGLHLMRSYRLRGWLLAISLVAICWIDFIAAHALNAVLVASLMGAILLLIYLRFSLARIKTPSYWALVLIFLVVHSLALFAFLQYDLKYERKLTHLVSDAQVAAQIAKSTQWRRDPNFQGPPTPVDEYGRPVNASTYERVSWFVKGLEFLKEHPWGAGFTDLPFRYFVLRVDPNLELAKTHSGWLDFALGSGLPGLLLTWLAMALIAYRAWGRMRRNKSANQSTSYVVYAGVWALGGIWVLWWPTELSEREFIEYLFFLIAFLGVINAGIFINERSNFYHGGSSK